MKLDDKLRLAAVLATEARGKTPSHLVAQDAAALIRLALQMNRIALQRCNGIERIHPKSGRLCSSWTEADEARADAAEAKIRDRANKVASAYRAKVTTGGDPRGYVFRLHLKSGRNNGMAGDGWGIG